jgi:uncharacterized protein
MKRISILLLLLFTFYNVCSAEVIDGRWKGNISIAGMKLTIATNFKTIAGKIEGKIDVVEQNAKDLKLTNIEVLNNTISFDLAANPKNVAKFTGTIFKDSIGGTFTQASYNGTFYLLKDNTVEKVEVKPYIEEEVSFYNNNIKIAGTLTKPKEGTNFPFVILITGSGQQNRDEEIFGFKIFALISDYLTKNGMGVLRCDDRGIGGTDGGDLENSTSQDFASDVVAEINYLKTRADVNKNKIGLFGHSEGGMIASMIASENSDVSYIVMMSGPCVSGDQILLSQLKALLKANGLMDSEIDRNMQLQKMANNAMKTGEGWDKFREQMKIMEYEKIRKLSEDERKNITNIDSAVEQNVNLQIKQAQLPWTKYFVQYDPTLVMNKIKCPILAMFGELDLQVIADINVLGLQNIMKDSPNKNWSYKVFPKANHLYQEAITGGFEEYAKLKKEFVPGFLEYFTEWIKKQ